MNASTSARSRAVARLYFPGSSGIVERSTYMLKFVSARA